MTRFRDTLEFWPTIVAAAAQRDISIEIVEKDYWVTETLRVLAADFPDDFVFKGGTSLSKGYRCVQRFSEDVDVLVLPGDRGRSEVERLMKRMVNAVADQVGMTHGERNRGRGLHHNEHLIYPSGFEGKRALAPDVFLEMGVRGEDDPTHEIRSIQSMLAEQLDNTPSFDASAYDDLSSFPVPTLHPARTLVEKVLLLHSTVATGGWSGEESSERPTRVGRHYYDIYELLGIDEVRTWLSDRPAFLAVVASHESINREWFDNDIPPRPDGGYADSDAFLSASPGNARLATFYKSAMRELHFVSDGWPSWSEVMDRIQEARLLL